ncbi:TolB family protein [Methanogenium cariaci]
MKTARIFAILVVASAIIPGIGTAISFGEEGPFPIAHPYNIISAPAAGGDRILWIESTPLSFPDPGYYPWVPCAVYSYNITSQTKTLIRPRANNARSPDIDGDLAVWEEERGSSTDIILYNFTTGTVSALHTNKFQQNPRLSEYCIVWEEGFVGEREIWMYNTKSGNLYGLSTGKTDCFSPDIEGNTVIWVEKTDQDGYSIVSRDLVSGRQFVLGTTSAATFPRIDGGKAIWEDEGLIHLASNEEGGSILTDEPACRSGAIISDTIVAWSEDGRIFCSDLLETQTTRIGKWHASMKPAILDEGIVWIEYDQSALSSILYQPFSPLPKAGLQVVPCATIMPPTRGEQSGQLREGECAWYALDISAGTTQASLDFSWEEVNDSLSCTLIGPGGTIFRFTDSDDEVMDARVRISVTSHAGIIPGRWYCAISGESIRKNVCYSLIWYEYQVQKE